VVLLGIILFTVIGVALILFRRPLAQMQAMVVGGRMGAGCATAEGIAFLLLALLVYIFRSAID
jgi:hypothetical protein